jgi:ornithine cyclodeaminase/alanine dehydrogenase-like protein (mu-crystallin family)
MQYFREMTVTETLMADAPAYIEYLKTRIGEIANGQKAWIKDKVIYDDPVHPDSGDIRSMTCFTDRVKVVKVISTNPIREKHYSVSVGATLLLDYEENFPVAVFDATMMSAIRTSAMAVISAQLTGADLDDILIVGWGRIGQFVYRLLQELGYENIRACDPKCSYLDMPMGVYQPMNTFNNGTVITATTSREPFLTPENCQAGFLVSVGADTHFNLELSGELLRERGGLYVDCWDAVDVGDVGHTGVGHIVHGDLFALYHERDARTFISVGSPLMDALTIEYLSNELL